MTRISLTPALTSFSASRSTSPAGRRNEVAAELRDDAERAAVVAALRNLQIGVVARRQLHALRRHEVDERIVRRRRGLVHGRDHALVLLRPGDREHVREAVADLLRLGAHAAGDDHLAVLGHGFADGVERFRLGAVEEAAGVDDHHVGAVMLLRQLVPLRAQLRDDALGIHQGLRAAKGDERDFRSGSIHPPGSSMSEAPFRSGTRRMRWRRGDGPNHVRSSPPLSLEGGSGAHHSWFRANARAYSKTGETATPGHGRSPCRQGETRQLGRRKLRLR